MPEPLDLQAAASPEQALQIIAKAVDAYRDSASELSGNWQSSSAGQPWAIIADELEKAYARADTRIRKTGYPMGFTR